MKLSTMAAACAGWLVAAATVLAQGDPSGGPIYGASLRYDYYQQEPAVEPSPSDLPVAPPTMPSIIPETDSYYEGLPPAEGSQPCWELSEPARWTMLPPSPQGISLTGWLQTGATASADAPANQSLAPLAFNDRRELQMNQLYAVLERPIDTSCRALDVGGRVDVLYGTDARFTEVPGWELQPDGSDRWSSQRYYRLSLPQLYAECGWRDLALKVGHWYSTVGYESVMAPANFFYSHSYARVYGEPFTFTGVLAEYALGNRVSLRGGVHNGWDNMDSVSDRAGALAGASWISCDERFGLSLVVTTGDQTDRRGRFSNLTLYDLIFRWQIAPRWEYVLEHVQGWQRYDGAQVADAEWYGISQYLLCTVNDCWKLGSRLEWFRDDDGIRVVTGDAGSYYEVTLGFVWQPNTNFVMRPELRWDWYDGAGRPYDGGTRTSQFSAAFDAIVLF